MFNPFCKARSLIRDGGAGRTERNSIRWNGDTTGKTDLGDGVYFVSDKTFTADQVVAVVMQLESGTMRLDENGYTMTLLDGTTQTGTELKLGISQPDEGLVQLSFIGTQLSFAISVGSDIEVDGAVEFAKGTYFVSPVGDFGGYVAAVELTDTIHPIDPKYLPGVCLPVVELTTVPTEDGAALTEAECALMNEVAAMGVPFVLKGEAEEGSSISVVCNWIAGMACVWLADAYILLVGEDGVWTIVIRPVA